MGRYALIQSAFRPERPKALARKLQQKTPWRYVQLRSVRVQERWFPVKALTIRQPWAWAIVFAGKNIENRTWITKYRGPLLIHAGDAYNADAELPRGVRVPPRDDLTFGAILGVVDLVDVVEDHRSRWFFGPYGFVLKNARAFAKPLPCKGRLGLWSPTPQQVAAVRRRLQ
jgi:hypothetical protein